MSVVMDNKPNEILKLVRGTKYKRKLGELSLRADASNCNIKSKWPNNIGEYGFMWAKTEKGVEKLID